jgi:phage terminase large subunit-like protein
MEWRAIRRQNQTPPDGDWSTWLNMAGRGFGKTRVGAEWTKERCLLNPGHRMAIVAPTFGDARDTCIEGDSGLQAIVPRSLIQTYNRSMGEFEFTNGAKVKLFSADEPDRLRGPQHHDAWCDELAAWRYQEAWDQLLFGLRLGDDPRAIVTTTPRPTPLLRSIIKDPRTIVTTGSTFDNAANLAPSALAQLRAKYEGTRLGRQELNAELLEDTPGALWTRAMLEQCAHSGALPEFDRVVIGVDPPAGEDGDAAECGIITAGRVGAGLTATAVVLADSSMQGSPNEWGKAVVDAYHAAKADRIVVEINQGGAMVKAIIRSIDPSVAITEVHATRSKKTRAEPIAALYEQVRVTHGRVFTALEDQMCSWAPGQGQRSPDRMDALVWALTDLMLGNVAPDPSIRRL